jgi:hypothetical protein
VYIVVKLRATLILILICALFGGVAPSAFPGPREAPVQEKESGEKIEGKLGILGHPMIQGSIGGSAAPIPEPNAFAVSFNFGELSPLNQNLVVRIAVTVTIHTSQRYQIRLSMTPPTISDPNAVQLSDVGVGIQNLRLLGAGTCAGTIQSPWNNDPAAVMTINPATFRATYPTTLATIASSSPIVIRGPALPSAGAAFDLVMVCAPQYYTPGTVNFTFTLALQAGSAFTCP